MIRILEVLATLRRAGAENMVAALVRNLDRERFLPAVVSLYDDFPEDLSSELEGIPVWRLGKRRGFDPRIYGRLRRVIREFLPDIIHTHSYVMRYTLPVWRGRAVHTIHNLAAREVDGVGRIVHKLGWRRGIVPVAVGRAVASTFSEVYGFPPHAIIPNGIDLFRYRQDEPARADWRRANGFSPHDLLIASVARLDPQKNPLMLAEAFDLASLPEAHLLLVGEGSLKPKLEGRARVHVLGVRSDIPGLLNAADLFALASDWEGYPLAALEALASGLPVVATAVGGVPEIVEDGVSGILTQAGDTVAFAAALRSLGVDENRRRAMAGAARQRSVCFSVTAMVQNYLILFEDLAERKELLTVR